MLRQFGLALGLVGLLATLTNESARAQLPLPTEVPGLPVQGIERLARDQLDTIDRQAAETRRSLLSGLLRDHRDVLERGPDGTVIVRRQITAIFSSGRAREAAFSAGYTLIRERPLPGLGLTVSVLEAPTRRSTRRALNDLQAIDPAGTYDFNPIYTRSGQHGSLPQQGLPRAGIPTLGSTTRVGLIDSGVDTTHPAFSGGTFRTRAFHGGPYLAGLHGTQTASLLVGQSPIAGVAQGADLISADIYGNDPTGGSVDALIAAFGWMAEEGVAVINVSLVGPDNRILRHIVALMVTRGHIIVAAVGNDGPSARPLFPSAYPGVIGVTGVDARGRVLPEAGRGDHVDFAALGVGIDAAAPGGGTSPVRGTSFAAPVIAGRLAPLLPAPDPVLVPELLGALRAGARDLGPTGRDPVYGDGLVSARPAAAFRQASQ